MAAGPGCGIFRSQRYWLHDWRELLDGRHPVLLVCVLLLVIATMRQWWIEMQYWRPRPNSGGTPLGSVVDARWNPLRSSIVALPSCVVVGSILAVFVALMIVPEEELPAELTTAVLVACAYLMFTLQRSIDSAVVLALHWPGIIVSRQPARPCGYLSGTVRALSEQFEGLDGAGPCVCAVPASAKHRGRAAVSRGVPFLIETASGPVGVTASDELDWGGMRIAPTSKRRASVDASLASVAGRDWLCLRDGDEVVIWCRAEAADVPLPGVDAYRGATLRVVSLLRQRDGETTLVGLGSLDEQRRAIWRSAVPSSRAVLIAPAVFVVAFIVARYVHMFSQNSVPPFWEL